MGSGGSTTPRARRGKIRQATEDDIRCLARYESEKRSSPRPISTGQLNTLPRLHFQPINPVVFRGSYSHEGMGKLILELASRLDAFSAYPFRTQLLSMCRWYDS